MLLHLFHTALLHLYFIIIIQDLLHSFLQLLTTIQRHLRERGETSKNLWLRSRGDKNRIRIHIKIDKDSGASWT